MAVPGHPLDRMFNPEVVAVIGDKGPGYSWLNNNLPFKERGGKLYSVQLDEKEIPGIEALGVTLELDQGAPVPAGDADGEFALLFITRGVIGMSATESDAAVEDQITSRAAGSAVSSKAFEPATGVPRLVAQTPATIVALTVRALERVESEHSTVAATLYRNAAAAVAAEYRWSAAENVALSR